MMSMAEGNGAYAGGEGGRALCVNSKAALTL